MPSPAHCVVFYPVCVVQRSQLADALLWAGLPVPDLQIVQRLNV